VFENPREARRQFQLPLLKSNNIKRSGSLSDWKFQLPIHLRSDTRILSRKISSSAADPPHQETTFVSPGFFMHTHVDNLLIPDFVVHVDGLKLWLIWPSTPQNFLTFTSHLLGDRSGVLEGDLHRAIQVLDGLKVLLIEKPQTTFILPAGFIHAVISFEPAIHLTGWYLDLNEFDGCIRVFDSYLDLLELESKKAKKSILHSEHFCKLDFTKSDTYQVHFESIVLWHNFFLEFEKKSVSRQVSKLRTSAKRFVKILNSFDAEITFSNCLSKTALVIFKDLVSGKSK
jgi:hypothetical protein